MLVNSLFLFNHIGYNCIPSDSTKDAVTLGMSPRHMELETFESLESFSARKREFHLEKLKEERSKILDDLRSSFLISKSLDIFNPPAAEENSSDGSTTAKSSSSTENEASKTATIPPELLTEIEQGVHEFIDDDEKFEKKIKEIVEKSQGAIDPFKKEDKPIFDILDNIDKYRDPEVELPVNMELFLPILTPEERRQLLIESGVDIIDNEEADEISDIRESRQFCGCKCKLDEACGTEECSCYAAGISCQLDRTRFPCGCSLKRCKNPSGIKRFDMRAVIDHYTAVLTDPDTYDPLAKPVEPPPVVVKETVSENRSAKKTNNRKRKPDPLTIQPRDQESSEQIGSYPISPVPKRSRTSLKQIQQQQALRQVSNESVAPLVDGVPKAAVDHLKQLAPVNKRARKKKEPVSSLVDVDVSTPIVVVAADPPPPPPPSVQLSGEVLPV